MELEKYPVNIGSERDTIMEIMKNQNVYLKIPKIWQQFLDKKDPVMLDSFELGVITSLVADQRLKIPEFWKQLINFMNKFRDEAGVTTTVLGTNFVQLKDKDGITMIREKYNGSNKYG